MTVTPFGPFAPDQVATAEILVGGKNSFPKADGTYGPVNALQAVFNALAQRCQGAFYSIDSARNTALWAGTAAKLYLLLTGSTFNDVSKAGGYHCGEKEAWEFEQVGTRILAWNINDPIQTYIMGTSSLFSDLSAAAPKARHGGMVSNFLLLGNTDDGVFGLQPDGLWWSGIGDVANWPVVGTAAAAAAQSGRTNISGKGGWIQRVLPRVGTLDAIILQEKQVSRCVYVGSPDVFQFPPMEGARGTPAPQSAVVYGGELLYLGEDGFYINNGTGSSAIGRGSIDMYFFNDLNDSLFHRIWAVVDNINRLYVVGYPSKSSSGNIDRLLMYNLISKQWAPPTEVSAEVLIRIGSLGYTLESLDAFGNIDTIMPSLDDPFWQGNALPVLGAFDGQHRAGTFTGTVQEAIFETGDVDLPESRRVMTLGVRPLVQGNQAGLTCSYGYRNTRNTPITYADDYRSLNRENVMPFRVNARHVRTLTRISAASSWKHAIGCELTGTDGGGL